MNSIMNIRLLQATSVIPAYILGITAGEIIGSIIY